MADDATHSRQFVLWYQQPAAKWDEALPIGNGRLGGMVYGGIDKECIRLNEDTLWSGFPKDTINPDAMEHLNEVRSLIGSRHNQAERLIESANQSPRSGNGHLSLFIGVSALHRCHSVIAIIVAQLRFRTKRLRSDFERRGWAPWPLV